LDGEGMYSHLKTKHSKGFFSDFVDKPADKGLPGFLCPGKTGSALKKAAQPVK
jgi:hypothetical protein